MSVHKAILVTGGAGFIGSHVVEQLVNAGCPVRVLDDLSSGKRSNLHPDAEFVEASITDATVLRHACRDVRAIIHLAAEVSVPRSIEEPAACVERNVLGTQRVIDAAIHSGVHRIVFASTAAVYGDNPPIPSTEDARPAPYSPYAATKLAGEYLLHSAAMNHGLSAACMRFFNVYGPGQDGTSAYSGVISAFLTARSKSIRPKIFGDGQQSRDFVSVFDVARAVLAAADGDLPSRHVVMNIGTGRSTTLLQLVQAIDGLSEPEFHEARAGDVRHSLPSVQRARDVLKFEASVNLSDGLRATGDWYEQNQREQANGAHP